MIQEKYLFKQAISECQRLENIASAVELGQEIAEEDLECHISDNQLD